MKCPRCQEETANRLYCDQCVAKLDALEKSLEPPAELQAMEHVMANGKASTHLQKVYKKMMDNQAVQFTDRLFKARETHRGHVLASQPKVAGAISGSAGSLADEGSDRVEELIEKLLNQAEQDAIAG